VAGIDVDPLRIALWGIPTAISAFVIHAWRLRRLDSWLEREVAGEAARSKAVAAPGASVQGVQAP
jgi:uncharacterized membrane protein